MVHSTFFERKAPVFCAIRSCSQIDSNLYTQIRSGGGLSIAEWKKSRQFAHALKDRSPRGKTDQQLWQRNSQNDLGVGKSRTPIGLQNIYLSCIPASLHPHDTGWSLHGPITESATIRPMAIGPPAFRRRRCKTQSLSFLAAK